MRAGHPISVRNAAVANTATQIFAPSAAGAALGAGQAVIRTLRIVQGAAHTSFTLNSFDPAGAGTATVIFRVFGAGSAAHRWEGLNLKCAPGHGMTALGAVGGSDGLLIMDGDRVDQQSIVNVRSFYAADNDDAGSPNFITIYPGVTMFHRGIVSCRTADGDGVIGYADDVAGANFVPFSPTVTGAPATTDFEFPFRIPDGKMLLARHTFVADSEITVYAECAQNHSYEEIKDVLSGVVNDSQNGDDTAFLTVRDTGATEDIELNDIHVTAGATSTVTVGYADVTGAGAAATYVPLTPNVANGTGRFKMSYVIPVGKKLLVRHVFTAGATTIRVPVTYRILSR